MLNENRLIVIEIYRKIWNKSIKFDKNRKMEIGCIETKKIKTFAKHVLKIFQTLENQTNN